MKQRTGKVAGHIQGKHILDILADLGAPATLTEIVRLLAVQYPRVRIDELKKRVKRALEAGVRYGFLQNEDVYFHPAIEPVNNADDSEDDDVMHKEFMDEVLVDGDGHSIESDNEKKTDEILVRQSKNEIVNNPKSDADEKLSSGFINLEEVDNYDYNNNDVDSNDVDNTADVNSEINNNDEDPNDIKSNDIVNIDDDDEVEVELDDDEVDDDAYNDALEEAQLYVSIFDEDPNDVEFDDEVDEDFDEVDLDDAVENEDEDDYDDDGDAMDDGDVDDGSDYYGNGYDEEEAQKIMQKGTNRGIKHDFGEPKLFMGVGKKKRDSRSPSPNPSNSSQGKASTKKIHSKKNMKENKKADKRPVSNRSKDTDINNSDDEDFTIPERKPKECAACKRRKSRSRSRRRKSRRARSRSRSRRGKRSKSRRGVSRRSRRR